MNSNRNTAFIEVWPGPMEGVMSDAFIKTVSQLKLVSRWMTPFYRVTDHVPKRKQINEFLAPFLETNLPVSGQIMGTDAGFLCRTALLMLDAGCCEVNLNCGCPSQRVVSGNAGGGALKDLEKLSYILKSLRDTLPDGRFSVKTRIGYDAPQYEEIINTIIGHGNPDRLTIHCRTVKEMYNNVDDMFQRFDRVIDITQTARSKGMKLILNGDIKSVEDARTLREKLPDCGVMCARSWMHDPSLLKRIENDDTAENCNDIKRIFFDTFMMYNSSRGAMLEIARMLWNRNSEEFSAVLNSKHFL